MQDPIGDYFKEQFENVYRTYLPEKSYVIVRVDGKAFHTFTRSFKRPFDTDLIDMMNATAVALCENIMGAKVAYVQSDEISILMTDVESEKSQPWFGNNLNKIVSLTASIATAEFNREYLKYLTKTDDSISIEGIKFAHFDSRAFIVDSKEDAEDYFQWRRDDCKRNAVNMIAQANFSHRTLQGLNTAGTLELLRDSEIDLNEFPSGFRFGRLIIKEKITVPQLRFFNKKTQQEEIAYDVVRNQWKVETFDKELLINNIPVKI